jgi:HAD superfamily hydrolase (TIGR01458 family)
MTALLIDLDGVLYEGEQAVPGAAEAIAWLGRQEIPFLFVTNTTSRPRRAIVEKLARLGIGATEEAIWTPPVAAAGWLLERALEPISLFVAPATLAEFGALEIAAADDTPVAAVVVGDYGERWDFAELNRAFRLLMQAPQPALIALGMTRYWLAEDGLRLDAAAFVMALAHASGVEPVVLGKPAKPFFDSALAMLGATPDDALMIGDDIKGDVGGARNAGIAGVLVRTGKFRDGDLEGDIRPDAVLGSIAELPDRWPALVPRTPEPAQKVAPEYDGRREAAKKRNVRGST